MTPPVITVSRSAIIAREACPRLRFLSTDLDGGGYEQIPSTVPLIQGTAGHAGLAQFLRATLRGASLEAALTEGVTEALVDFDDAVATRGFSVELSDATLAHTYREQRWLLEVVLRGWVAERWPLLTEQYTLAMAPEAPWSWELAPGIVEPLRMDAVLAHRDTGALTIMDFKWTATAGAGWVTQHAYSRQSLLYVQALTERLSNIATLSGELVTDAHGVAGAHTPVDVEGIIYEGLVRGYWKKDTAASSRWSGLRIQQTPWCYGYDGPGGLQIAGTTKKGYHKVAAWEVATAEDWIARMRHEGYLAEMFATTMPLRVPTETRTRRVRQIGLAELRWREATQAWQQLATAGADPAVLEDTLDQFAPQHTEHCAKYGSESLCQFASICNTPGGWQDLGDDSRFRRRVDHHAPVDTPPEIT